MQIYTMKQQTPEWYEIKKLMFTASHASTIIAMGKGLDTLIHEMLCEYYSSGVYEEYSQKYTNKQMQRGNEYEDKARSIYELETGNQVDQVGFVKLKEHIGCSPDGLVGDDGLIEIKNHSDTVFMKLLYDRKIDKKYFDQMQYQMYVTGRQWCDYFGFNPNFKIPYVLIRIKREPEVFERITDALDYAVPKLIQKKLVYDKLFNA